MTMMFLTIFDEALQPLQTTSKHVNHFIFELKVNPSSARPFSEKSVFRLLKF